MPEANLAIMPQTAGQIVVSNEWEKQLELVQRTVAFGLNSEEFQLFCHIARVRHLDPLQRQIHAVKRKTWNKELNGGNGGWEEKMTIQTGIDGYRSIANRTGLYMPSDKEAQIDDLAKPTMRITMWVKKYHPLSNSWHEFGATAWYAEFVQTRKDANKQDVPNSMWAKMPVNQLTKCAEALALRKGWPEELGGIYVDEEMQHLDTSQVVPPENNPPNRPSQQNKTQREVGTLKQSKEPNRGHGNEGTERQQQKQPEKVMCAECRQVDGHSPDCKQAKKETGKKMSSRERWEKSEGHDPKIHIGFDDGLQLFYLQKDLSLSEEEMKSFLFKGWKVEHRYLVPKAKFQDILSAMAKQYGKQPVNPDAEDPEENDEPDSTEDAGNRNTATDGLFDK